MKTLTWTLAELEDVLAELRDGPSEDGYRLSVLSKAVRMLLVDQIEAYKDAEHEARKP